MSPSMLRRSAKIIVPLTGFLPVCVLTLKFFGLVTNDLVFHLAIFTLFPAFSLGMLAKSFWGAKMASVVIAVAAIAWSSLLTLVIHRFTKLFTAEDFAWSDFWGGLVLGFLPGLLLGWRIWIRCYKVASLTSCLVLGGLIVGFGLGTYMGSCWSKQKL